MNSNVGVALIEVLNIHKIVKPLTRVFLGGACLLSTAAHALDINLIEDVAAPLNNDQRNGFIEAAGIWESRISSNVTVNIKVGMVSLSSNVIGQLVQRGIVQVIPTFEPVLLNLQPVPPMQRFSPPSPLAPRILVSSIKLTIRRAVILTPLG